MESPRAGVEKAVGTKRKPPSLVEFNRRLKEISAGPEPGKNLADFVVEELESIDPEEQRKFIETLVMAVFNASMELVGVAVRAIETRDVQ